jgi:hypothetical protein
MALRSINLAARAARVGPFPASFWEMEQPGRFDHGRDSRAVEKSDEADTGPFGTPALMPGQQPSSSGHPGMNAGAATEFLGAPRHEFRGSNRAE